MDIFVQLVPRQCTDFFISSYKSHVDLLQYFLIDVFVIEKHYWFHKLTSNPATVLISNFSDIFSVDFLGGFSM